MFAGKKSAQIREILINESAWEEMTCLFAPSLGFRLKIDSSMPMLPSRQHDNWRWAKSDELVRDETVHKNTRAYFDPKMQQQVPGI